jgi:hypothetical protein
MALPQAWIFGPIPPGLELIASASAIRAGMIPMLGIALLALAGAAVTQISKQRNGGRA